MPIESQQKSDCSNRLSHNESPYPPLININEVLNTLPLNRYPESDYGELTSALAAQCGVTPEEVIVGNGSDECIRLVIDAFSKPYDKIIIPTPTFSEYSLISRVCYRTPVECIQKNLSFDLQSIAETARSSEATMIFICSPNNPTGALIAESDLRDLMNKTTCTVVLDEAYIEFSTESLSLLFRDYPKLIVLRTLSKAYGLAGLRLGYCLSQPHNIQKLTAVRAPYAVSSLSAQIAQQALANSPFFLNRVEEIIKRRDSLMVILQKYTQLKPYKSSANFILIDAGPSYDLLSQAIQNIGMQLRFFSSPELKNHLRITIGDEESIKAFADILKEVFQ